MRQFITLVLLSFMLGACSTTEYDRIDSETDTIGEKIGDINKDLDKLNRDAGIVEDKNDDTPRKNSASKLYNKYINE